MKPRPPFHLLLITAALLLPAVLKAEQSSLPTDEQIHQILEERIEKDKHGVAIVVGLIDEKGSRVVAFGNTIKGGGVPVDSKTVFEIGSVTKVFTTLLLADMAAKGEVKLEDPVARYLPKEVKVPARGGREITLLDLATHRSGLPSMPDNMKPKDEKHPMADYTVPQMFAFLSGYVLTRDIGSEEEYSNLGVALLGHALAFHTGKSYEALVVERVCKPLGMLNTRINLSKSMLEHLAEPYDASLAPAGYEELPALAGAGALRSNMDDMLKFMTAQMGFTETPLSAAMRETQKLRATKNDRMAIGLGWLILKRYDPPLWWQNGGTAGFRSFVGMNPAAKTAVVVLSNSALGVDDIGFHVLDSRFELEAPVKQRTAIKIKPETADQYLGKYEVVPQFVMKFTREGDRYFVQPNDDPKDEVFPETETRFFSRSFDGQIEFVKDADGKYISLILHQGGIPDQKARRLP